MHDVAIVGAGPAGCALAIHLAAGGLDVVVIDPHPAEPALRPDLPGERLWSDSRWQLERLGVPCEEVSIPSAATEIAWDTAEPRMVVEQNPLRWAFAVDRRRLDAALAASAARNGAEFRHGEGLGGIAGEPGAWSLLLDGGSTMGARFVVDATGRGSHLAARLRIRRQRADALVAALRWWAGADERAPFQVEAVTDGWFYRLPLSGGPGVMGAVTFRKLVPGTAMQAWNRIASRLAMIAPRPPAGARLGEPAFFAASPSWITQPIGPGFSAVGEACLAGDPIEGRGIDRALRLAEALAMLMLSPAELGEGRAREYCALLEALRSDHAAVRAAQYAQAPRLGPHFQALLRA